jgi:hypothetical protein
MTPDPKSITDSISLQQAIDLTRQYRKEKENILKPEFQGKDILPISEYFQRKDFEDLLGEEGCVGIRAYFCMDPSLKIKLFFVGVNAKNEDLLPLLAQTTLPTVGFTIQNNGTRCPPTCPPPNPINP